MGNKNTEKRKRNRRNKLQKITKQTTKPQTKQPTKMAQSKNTASIDQVQKQLAAVSLSNNRGVMRMSPYTHCRVSPFTATGQAYIPDGSAVRRVTKDVRVFYDVTIGSSGGFIMMAIPELPRGVVFKDLVASPTTGVTVSGVSLSGTRQGPGQDGSWFGPTLPGWATFLNTTPANEAIQNPWGASKVRIITQAYRIMYTGASLNCAGTITVSENEASVTKAPSPNVGVITQYQANSTADTNTWAAGTAPHRSVDIYTSTSVLNSTSTILPMAQGAYFILSRSTPQPIWCDVAPFLLVQQKTTAMMAYIPSTTFAHSCVYDDSFTPKMVVVSGMVAGTTVRVEMKLCLEFEPNLTSVYSDLAAVPQGENTNIISATEKAIGKLPTAGPLTWSETIKDSIHTVMRAVKYFI